MGSQKNHLNEIVLLSTQNISGIFFEILGRGPRAFQIGKISGVNPSIGNFVIKHNYGKKTN